MKNTIVISAFPCCGKSYAFKKLLQEGYSVWDSDSSDFSWIYSKQAYVDRISVKDRVEKVRNPEFPYNYIEHIKSGIGHVDIIFVSSHKVVRDALKKAGIHYIVAYPSKEMLNEWIGRAYTRGSGTDFCDMLINNWDNWIDEIETEHKEYPSKFMPCRLSYNTYLNLYSFCKSFVIPTYIRKDN